MPVPPYVTVPRDYHGGEISDKFELIVSNLPGRSLLVE